MQVFDNVNKTVKDDLTVTIQKGSKLSVAAACFSIYAYQILKKQLDSIGELRFIRQIAGEQLDDTDSEIKKAISLDERRQKLAKEFTALERKVQREKQFNRQIELNVELKWLRDELERLI